VARIPPRKDPAPLYIDRAKKPPIRKVRSSTTVDFTGTGFDAIARAYLYKDEPNADNNSDRKRLPFSVYDDGEAVTVVVDRDAISTPGKWIVRFETHTGVTGEATLLACGTPVRTDVTA
jgi:hypothetical protein